MSFPELQIPDLTQELENLLRQIPSGGVTTFGDLAWALGDVGAARWVAQRVRSGELRNDLPIHRVVMKSGEMGVGNPVDQRSLLTGEGVKITKGRVEFANGPFQDFHSTQPLAVLKSAQDNVRDGLEFVPFAETPDEIAAVDLSYLDDGTAVGCYALVETTTGKLVWSDTVHCRVPFPYISGYLAYREMPILLELLVHVQKQRPVTDVLFVDGNGILHPRRAGIASHLGVLTGLRTAGVGKKLLCGKVDLAKVRPDSPQPIQDGSETIGMAMKAEEYSKPIFVSPGHRIDVPSAARLARLLFHGHRIPEPIYFADALSRQNAKSLMASKGNAGDPSPPSPENP